MGSFYALVSSQLSNVSPFLFHRREEAYPWQTSFLEVFFLDLRYHSSAFYQPSSMFCGRDGIRHTAAS